MVRGFLIATTLVLAAFVALVRAPAASAYGLCPGDDVVVNVYQTVVNDTDVGLAGNSWASTSYMRNLVVVRQGGQSFCAYSTVAGKFVSIEGVSPGATGFLRAGVTGYMIGRWKTGTFWGRFEPKAPTRGFIGSVDACGGSPWCPGFDWRSLYFRETSGATVTASAWGFSTSEYGYFVRRNEPGLVGTSGDITG